MAYDEAKKQVFDRWHLDQKFRIVDVEDFETLVTDFNQLNDTIKVVAQEYDLDENVLASLVHQST